MRSTTPKSEGELTRLLDIESIEAIQVKVPRLDRNRITTSYATLPDAHHTLVKVNAQGLIGIGEAPTELWWTGEDAASVSNAVRRYLAPPLIRSPIGIREAARRMDAAVAANPYAKAAVEMALWDLLGKQLDIPLHQLIGGGPPLSVPVKYVIGILDESRAEAEAHWAVQAGFSWLKVKVGGQLDTDLNRVRAVMDAAPAAIVGVDANEGWDVPTAMRAVSELERLGVSFVEQPVSRAYESALAELSRRTEIPIVLHESIFTVRDAVTCAERRLGDIWAITPSAHGGLIATMDILAIAHAFGIPCLLGSTIELGIATAFLAQVACSYRNIADAPIPSDIIGPLYHADDVVVASPEVRAGFVAVPVGPGLGVELDEQRVNRYRVDGKS